MLPSGEIPGCLSLTEAVNLAEALTHGPYDIAMYGQGLRTMHRVDISWLFDSVNKALN